MLKVTYDIFNNFIADKGGISIGLSCTNFKQRGVTFFGRKSHSKYE